MADRDPPTATATLAFAIWNAQNSDRLANVVANPTLDGVNALAAAAFEAGWVQRGSWDQGSVVEGEDR